MELSAQLSGTCLVATVGVSEVDHTVSDDFRDALLSRYERAGAVDLLLDLTQVAFMDSKAIGAMVTMRKTAANRGGRLGVCNLHPHVDKIIRVVTLGTLFEAYPDREAAVAKLCGGGGVDSGGRR